MWSCAGSGSLNLAAISKRFPRSPGIFRALEHRSGLKAAILSDGVIRVGDPMRCAKRRGRRLAGAIKAMEFGLHLPASSSAVKSEDLIRFVQTAETLGFYCITVADHVIVPKNISIPYPYTVDGKYPGTGYHLETLTTMSFLAGATQRIRFITSVMIAPYRNPVITAKMLASLDVLSQGRVIVGLGVGWMKEEFDNLKAPPFHERGRVTDEYISAFRELWTKEKPDPSTASTAISRISFFCPSRCKSQPFRFGSAAIANKHCAGPANWATAGIPSAVCQPFLWSRKTWRET